MIKNIRNRFEVNKLFLYVSLKVFKWILKWLFNIFYSMFKLLCIDIIISKKYFLTFLIFENNFFN